MNRQTGMSLPSHPPFHPTPRILQMLLSHCCCPTVSNLVRIVAVPAVVLNHRPAQCQRHRILRRPRIRPFGQMHLPLDWPAHCFQRTHFVRCCPGMLALLGHRHSWQWQQQRQWHGHWQASGQSTKYEFLITQCFTGGRQQLELPPNFLFDGSGRAGSLFPTANFFASDAAASIVHQQKTALPNSDGESSPRSSWSLLHFIGKNLGHFSVSNRRLLPTRTNSTITKSIIWK